MALYLDTLRLELAIHELQTNISWKNLIKCMDYKEESFMELIITGVHTVSVILYLQYFPKHSKHSVFLTHPKKKKKTLFCLNSLSADLIPRSHSLSMTIKTVFLCFSILYYRQNSFPFPNPQIHMLKQYPM